MLKKSLLSLCAAALVSTSAMAVQYQLAPKMDMTYSLPSNTPTEVHNPLFFTIKATCVVETPDIENVVRVVVLKKSADINGSPMNAGDQQTLTFRNGDSFSINAKAGATAQLTNLGASTITAHCVTN